MTPMEALLAHQQLCDEVHALALTENRFLQEHRCVPDPNLLEQKRTLLDRLDKTLGALRAAPRTPASDPRFALALEKTRSRILQILQLDRENEQLLLRYSLAGPRFAAPAAPRSQLQQIYHRHGP